MDTGCHTSELPSPLGDLHSAPLCTFIQFSDLCRLLPAPRHCRLKSRSDDCSAVATRVPFAGHSPLARTSSWTPLPRHTAFCKLWHSGIRAHSPVAGQWVPHSTAGGDQCGPSAVSDAENPQAPLCLQMLAVPALIRSSVDLCLLLFFVFFFLMSQTGWDALLPPTKPQLPE